MKRPGQRYVQYINRIYRCSVTLREERCLFCLGREEDYVFACYRHVELSPFRASMVERPAEYHRSSYPTDAQGKPTTFLTHRPVYTALNECDKIGQAVYQPLFRYQLDSRMVDGMRTAMKGNYLLGSSQFQEQAAFTPAPRVTPGKSGRMLIKRSVGFARSIACGTIS